MFIFFFILFVAIGLPSAVLWAFGVTILVGLYKEIKDGTKEGGSGFSFKDLAADLLGCLLAMAGMVYLAAQA